MDNYNGYICKICNNVVTEKKHFWKEHKVSESDYFQKYLPKFDLVTSERIPFKSYESYILTDFVKRLNLKKYLESLTKEDASKYLIKWLIKRNEFKNIIYGPGEFESGTLIFPSVKYIINTYGLDFYKRICLDSNLLLNYDYDINLNTLYNFDKNSEIIVDTREQRFLKFNKFIVKKLNFGDYTIDGSNIFIERKSLIDFLGTLSKGYDRFNNEIQRVVKEDKYLIILLEEKYSSINSFPYLPHAKRAQAEPYFIQHRARELIHSYPLNIQFLAVNGRFEAKRIIEKIFKINNNIKKIDLQYLYNIKQL